MGRGHNTQPPTCRVSWDLPAHTSRWQQQRRARVQGSKGEAAGARVSADLVVGLQAGPTARTAVLTRRGAARAHGASLGAGLG